MPIEATTGSNPACRRAITSVLPSTTHARSSRAIDARALSSPYTIAPLWKSSDSGVFTYFGGERIVLVQLARLEAEHAALPVGEREQETPLEVVVAALARQAGGAQLLASEAFLERLARERCPTESEAEPKVTADLLVQTASLQIVTRHAARLRLPERALVERRGLLEQGDEPLTSLAGGVLGRRALLVLDRHAEPLAEPLDRAREVEPLRLSHERDQVALRAAAEAVVELVDRVDRERRRALVVERAASGVAAARLAQLCARRDDVDEVGGRLDGLDGGVLDPRHLQGGSVRQSEAVGHPGDELDDLVLVVASVDQVLVDPADRRVGALVLGTRHRGEVDVVEHEPAQRQHRGSDLVALCDVARSGRGLDQVVHERVDPLGAGRAERLDLGARQVGARRGCRSGSRRRCRG